MKQIQNIHAWSLVREEAVAYYLARGKMAGVTRDSGEAATCSLVQEGRQRAVFRARRETPKPLLSRSSRLQPAYIH